MVAGHLQRDADCPHAAVHHVRWRNDVRARRNLVERLIDQHRHRVVIGYIAGGVEQAVLAVAGVGVERDIGEYADIRTAGLANRFDRAAYQIVGVERFLAAVAAQLSLRVGEQRHAGDAERDGFLGASRDPVDRPARDAGQAGDRLLHPLAGGDEQRPDQIARGEAGFAVQRAAPAARSGSA